MIWLVVIGLAAAALIIGMVVFKVKRAALTSFASALVLGLAGYATQASPELPGKPTKSVPDAQNSAGELIDIRRMLAGNASTTASSGLLLADAMTRKGEHEQAAQILSVMVGKDPNDHEAWLALGNALVEHAKGQRTNPALYAYRQAAKLQPGYLGSGYFVGLSYIREGQFADTRSIWAETIEKADPTAPGLEQMKVQLSRLDQLLAAAAQMQQGPATGPQQTPAAGQ